MERLSETELQDMLQRATAKVVIGGRYRHFKDPSHVYTVQSLVIWVGTNEVAVIYKALYGAEVTFARALSEWLEVVEWGGRPMARFTRLPDKT